MQKKPPSTLLRRSFAFLRRAGTYLLGSGAKEAKRRAEQRAERLAQRRKMLWGKIDGRAVSTPTSARRWPGSRRESFTKRTLSSPETSAPFASMAATTTTRSSCADPSQELRLRTMTEREQRRAYKLQQRNNVPNEHFTNDTQATLLGTRSPNIAQIYIITPKKKNIYIYTCTSCFHFLKASPGAHATSIN